MKLCFCVRIGACGPCTGYVGVRDGVEIELCSSEVQRSFIVFPQ